MRNINEILRDVASGDQRIAESTRIIKSGQEEQIQREAGDLYDVIVSSRDQAIRHLQHPDLSVRKAALSLFASHWPPDMVVETVCEHLARTASRELQVRAISVLSFIRNRLHGTKVSATLAEFALASEIKTEVRREVYCLLRCSFGTIEQRLAAMKACREVRNEGVEIDPEVIQQCVDAENRKSTFELEESHREAIALHKEGQKLLEMGKPAESESLFSQALTAWPESVGSLFRRGQAREALGHLEEAIADCSAVISRAPNVAMFYRYRARLHRCLKQNQLAQLDLERAEMLETF